MGIATAFVLGHIQKPKAAAAASTSAPSTLHSLLHIALQPPQAPRVWGPYLSPINYIYKLLHSGAWGPPPRFSFIQTCQITLVNFLSASPIPLHNPPLTPHPPHTT